MRIDRQTHTHEIHSMSGKTKHIQVRVSPAEKAAIERLAASTNMDVSTYLRTRALPAHRERFDGLVARLANGDPADRPYVLAELNDLLTSLSAAELPDAVAAADVGPLPPYEGNYLAAMVEQACARNGVAPPGWTAAVPPIDRPRFVVEFESLRPHLLRASPVPFKRRNIFIDATLGDRV
ncbi:MAG: hypothetical protein WD120_03085 [Gemmatimonadota bacterium]